MAFNKQNWQNNLKQFAFWAKIQLRLMFIGLLAIILFCFGIIFTILAVIAAPFIGWWGKKRFDKAFYKGRRSSFKEEARKENHQEPKGDYVDVDYEIIDEDKEKK